jgi:hypothetical protein
MSEIRLFVCVVESQIHRVKLDRWMPLEIMATLSVIGQSVCELQLEPPLYFVDLVDLKWSM